MNVLIIKQIWGQFCEYMSHCMNNNKNVDVVEPFNSATYSKYFWKSKLPHIVMRGLYGKLNIPCMSLFLGSWKENINNYSQVIIFSDTPLKWEIIKYIKQKAPSCNIIMWWYDSVIPTNKDVRKIFEVTKKNIFKMYTFDKEDSKEYKMNFSEQFYLPITLKCHINKIKYDVMYCGSEKGRINDILKAKQLLDLHKINSLFYVKGKTTEECGIVETDDIPYAKYIEYVMDSKCILEINLPNQSGLTMRAMESIFYQKKLITNNIHITEYDFYNPNNIFILGKDDENKLATFINSEYVSIPSGIINKYSFKGWLSRLGIEM